MTNQMNVSITTLRQILSITSIFPGCITSQKTLAASMITTTFLLIMMGVITFSNGRSINAQMITGNQGGFGNLNTSLSQAMIAAEQSVGNNSSAIAAFGEEAGGHLVYRIILGTHGTEFYVVTINPGNGKVLAREELSQQELEKRHLEHSEKVLTEPHLMNNTFVH